MPLSGVIGRASIMDAPEAGGLGGTYAGNPMACAAGLAVIEIIKDEHILEKSVVLGDKLKARLKQMSMRNDLPPMDDIRGLGAMVAFDIVTSRGSQEPDAERTKKLMSEALKRGLILLTCGLYGNGVRVLVPITVEDKVLDEGLAILEESLKAVA